MKYEPLVFSVQGGIQKNAEAILTQLAVDISRQEGKASSLIKAEITRDLSLSLLRSAVTAVAKRTPRWIRYHDNAGSRLIAASNFRSRRLRAERPRLWTPASQQPGTRTMHAKAFIRLSRRMGSGGAAAR